MKVTTVGLDLAKNVFHVYAVDERDQHLHEQFAQRLHEREVDVAERVEPAAGAQPSAFGAAGNHSHATSHTQSPLGGQGGRVPGQRPEHGTQRSNEDARRHRVLWAAPAGLASSGRRR